MISNVTKGAITALLAADNSATTAEREAVANALNGRVPAESHEAKPAPFPAVMSAAEVAKVTGLSVRSLRTYAARGHITPAYFAGSSRAHGYDAASVRKFIESATAKKEVAA